VYKRQAIQVQVRGILAGILYPSLIGDNGGAGRGGWEIRRRRIISRER
jgi:hypothetical protein